MDDVLMRAMHAAGWQAGRSVDVDRWIVPLSREGFVINEKCRQILAGFGGLTVRTVFGDRGLPRMVFDPLDAASGEADLAVKLSVRCGENCSPIGMWDEQYVAFITERGAILITGPGVVSKVADSITDFLTAVAHDRVVSESSVL